jgi:hypothetical protein
MSHWPKLLRTVQVFTCEEVTQEWSLQCSNGDKIIGLPVPGHAALVEANDSLRIILSRKTFGNLLSRHELSEKLCEFFKIPGVRISHLSDILSEDNHNTLTGLLERYGIPKLDSKFEDHSAPPVTSKNEGHKSQGKEDNTEKRKARNGSGKADKQSASNTNFNRSSKSAPKRSQILLVEGVFDEDDHVHITRHVGHSGCKPDGKSTTGIIQEQGATLVSSSLSRASIFVLISFPWPVCKVASKDPSPRADRQRYSSTRFGE